MKELVKKSVIVLIVVAIMAVLFSGIMAEVNAADDFSTMISNINAEDDGSGASDAAQSIVGAILTIAKVIAVGVALIMLVVLAIKYMSSAPGDKAEIKKHAVVYVVGAVVLFASAAILEIIEDFATDNIKANGTTNAQT